MPRPAGGHAQGVRGVTGPHWRERPIVFACEGDRLMGIAALPDQPSDTGLVIVVGGPQYRAGSHRQFTLLARHLAGENVASLRFDYRGMGDSEGDPRNFESINADIRAAVDALLEQVPGLTKIILWGLCDAASAALFYGYTDSRVRGMVLLNPWVHSEASAAHVRLKYYYWNRLKQPSFWKKLLVGKVGAVVSLKEIFGSVGKLTARLTVKAAVPSNSQLDTPHRGFIERMRHGLTCFEGKVLILLSGQDATAREFELLINGDAAWMKASTSPNVEIHSIPEANHTFSSQPWRQRATIETASWILVNQSEPFQEFPQ
ncbi:hydrolase 1, exosortase A system-associated [Methylomagnum sp.]